MLNSKATGSAIHNASSNMLSFTGSFVLVFPSSYL